MERTTGLHTRLFPMATLVLAISLAGCSGSSDISQPLDGGNGGMEAGDGSASGGGSGNGDDGDSMQSSSVERVIQDGSGVTGGAGDTVTALGGAIQQVDSPLLGGVTDGSGQVLKDLGDGVNLLSDGLNNGLGSISTNDNALGTTLAGASGLVSQTGVAVSDAGGIVEGLGSLPVLMQVEEGAGVLASLGGTVDQLGGTVTAVGDQLTFTLTDEDGLTTELTGVVRPLLVNLEGTTQRLGDTLVVGPVGNNLLGQAGEAVVLLGDRLGDDVKLAGVGDLVTSTGLLVGDTGGLLTRRESGSLELGLPGVKGGLVDTDNGLLNGLDGLTGGLLVGDNGLVVGDNSLLASTLSAQGGLLDDPALVLGGLDGGLLGGDGGLLGGLTGTTGGLLGGSEGSLLGEEGGLGSGVSGTVDGVVGGLLGGEEGGLLGGDSASLADAGGLVGGVGDTVDGVTDTVDGLTGGSLEGVTGTVDDVAHGLLGGSNSDNDVGAESGGGLIDGLLGGRLLGDR